jgi:hypothetical protein
MIDVFLLYVRINGCIAALAQSVERKALNLVVVGSSPTGGVLFCFFFCHSIVYFSFLPSVLSPFFLHFSHSIIGKHWLVHPRSSKFQLRKPSRDQVFFFCLPMAIAMRTIMIATIMLVVVAIPHPSGHTTLNPAPIGLRKPAGDTHAAALLNKLHHRSPPTHLASSSDVTKATPAAPVPNSNLAAGTVDMSQGRPSAEKEWEKGYLGSYKQFKLGHKAVSACGVYAKNAMKRVYAN